jgi:Uncharacterized conserved protein
MVAITVRVVPRSGRTAVESVPGGIVVRVRAAPEGGRATEEAAKALAVALGLPRTRVRLRTGARSRTKVFDLEGITPDELRRRLPGA